MESKNKQKPNFFSGTDTYGRQIEVGIRNDGIQFFRSYSFNGYAMSWTKWKNLEEQKEIVEIDGETTMKWGWNILIGFYSTSFRLPKN